MTHNGVVQIDPSLSAGTVTRVHTMGGRAGALSFLRTVIFVGALLLSLVGGASSASADTGKGQAHAKPAGVTWERAPGGVMLSAGVTWE